MPNNFSRTSKFIIKRIFLILLLMYSALLSSFLALAQSSHTVNQSRYDTFDITELLGEMSGFETLVAQNIENVSLFNETFQPLSPLKNLRFNNYSQHYAHAVSHYYSGIRKLFGLNQTRNIPEAIIELTASSRFGCNEATLMLANGHLLGQFGLSQSDYLAFNYYKEIAKAWAAQIADTPAYQYVYNQMMVDILLGEAADEDNVPKAERQHMIQVLLDKEGNELPLYGNIVAAGALTGNFGFKEDEFFSAIFALVGSQDQVKIKINQQYQSIEKIIEFQRRLENNDEKLDKLDRKELKKSRFLTLFEGLQEKFDKLVDQKTVEAEKEDIEAEEENAQDEVVNYEIPTTYKEEMDKYIKNYAMDGINLLNYKESIPLTDEAWYDQCKRLIKDVAWKIYKEYPYYEVFDGLPKDPSLNDVFEALYYSNSSLVNLAAKIFIDRTDTKAELQNLRNNQNLINQGYEKYVEAMASSPQVTRAWKETCARKGQNFGLLGFFIQNEDFVPKRFWDNDEYKNVGRMLNLGSVFYGCHMGLTGLGFLAMEGYRPLKIDAEEIADQKKQTNNKIDDLRVSPLELSPIKQSHYREPALTESLMAFDIASQAGSFESSFYLSLVLGRWIYELCPKFLNRGHFYFDKKFIDNNQLKFDPYKNVPINPALAKAAAEHAAHAGHIGGEILRSLLMHEAKNELNRDVKQATLLLKRNALRIAQDWYIKDWIQEEVETNKTKAFSYYYACAISGDDVCLYNWLRLSDEIKISNNYKVCYPLRSGRNECVTGRKAFLFHLIEVGSINTVSSPAVIQQVARLCKQDSRICMKAIFGFDGEYMASNGNKLVTYMRRQLLLNNTIKGYLDLVVEQLNKFTEEQADLLQYCKNFVLKFIPSLKFGRKQQKKVELPKFQNMKDLRKWLLNNDQIKPQEFQVGAHKQLLRLQKNTKQSIFSQLIYDCFFDDKITVYSYSSKYPSCLLVSGLLQGLQGDRFARALGYSARKDNQNLFSEQTKDQLEKDQTYYQALVLDLQTQAPDMFLAKFADFGKFVKSLNTRMQVGIFGSYNRSEVKETHANDHYELSDLGFLTEIIDQNNIADFSYQELFRILAELKQETQAKQLDITINGKNGSGLLHPSIQARKSRFDFDSLNETLQMTQMQWFMVATAVLQSNKRFLASVLGFLIYQFQYDKYVRMHAEGKKMNLIGSVLVYIRPEKLLVVFVKQTIKRLKGKKTKQEAVAGAETAKPEEESDASFDLANLNYDGGFAEDVGKVVGVKGETLVDEKLESGNLEVDQK